MQPILTTAILMRTDRSKPPVAYQMSQPLPGNPDTVITKLIRVGESVEVFARDNKAQEEGIRFTLCQPTVTTLISLLPASSLKEYFEESEGADTVTEVYDIDGTPWRLNTPSPIDPNMIVTKMVYTEDGVDIVVMPPAGSEYATYGQVILFTLLPFAFTHVMSRAPLSAWSDIQIEIEEALAADPDDEPDDEEEEEEEPLQAAAPPPPPPPPPPPAVNGASVLPSGVAAAVAAATSQE